MDEFRGLLNLILLILFVAASVLGPAVERWRRRKEAERRARQAAAPAPEPEVEEAEPPKEEPKLPYEDVLQELFGPYIDRKRREAEEARRQAEVEVIEVVEEPPPPRVVEPQREHRSLVQIEHMVAQPLGEVAAASTTWVAAVASLDARIFRNPRLTPGAKLVLASEILGKPRSLRGRSR